MLFPPVPLGSKTLSPEVLSEDKKNCLKFGPCGVGKQALYLGGRFLDRRFYLPWKEVKRVFKRVAMSKGGFTGKGVFTIVQEQDGWGKLKSGAGWISLAYTTKL